MTDPTGTPYDPGTAQTEAESTQGMSKPHDRPVDLRWLHEGVDILLEVDRTTTSSTQRAYAGIKALMLAGWLAPQERTLAVPNGLVLAEEQWRLLEDFKDVTVMLPGGRHVLTLRAAALHPHTHFEVGSELHDELWAQREEVARRSSQHVGRAVQTVAVPRSFLTSLVALVDALREAGDFAAANSLDNFLAAIRSELQGAGISHDDHGRDELPDMNVQARTKQMLHALSYDPQLYRDVRTVLEYVSGGRRAIGALGTYPDNVARRALGRLDDLERAAGTPPRLTPEAVWRAGEGLIGETFTVNVPRDDVTTHVKEFIDSHARIYGKSSGAVPHPATAEEDLRHQLDQRTDDCEKVRTELLPILQSHPQTKDEIESPQPDTLRAGYVAKVAARLLTWYAGELDESHHEFDLSRREVERMHREGVPGVIHEVDRAFYDLAVKERNLEQMKFERMEAEVNRLKGALDATQRGLIAMETQRDVLRAAICEAAGFEFDEVNPIDTDFVTLAKLLARNEQMYDSEYDAVVAWTITRKTKDKS